MEKYFRKTLSLVLIGAMLCFYAVYPALSYAQTATDTPTPTVDNSDSAPTPTTAPDSSATVTPTPTVDPNASPTDTPTPTIDPNASLTPTPTIDPDASPTDSPTPTVDPSLSTTPTPTVDPNASPTPSDPTNTGILDNTATSSAVTGEDSITATGSSDSSDQDNPSDSGDNSNPNPSSGNNPGTNIGTGEALSLINSDTGVNVTSINSNVIVQTLNIFVAQNGSIDLSDPFTIAAQAISDHPDSPVINVSVTNVNNFAYITNDVASEAITGDNLINTADQSASITTGNAYSVVSLLNKVNFTIDNSTIHVITINIFGTLNGNIILPDMNASTDCSSCGMDIAANNNATVNNNVTSAANTGDNTATGSATITTGNAESAVNAINLVNTNLYNATAQVLFINDFGLWTGNFIGWGDIDPAGGGASLALFNLSPSNSATGSGTCATCSGTLGNVYNSASVTNDISSLTDSGGNSLNANGTITTGDAYSAVSLINFIDSNFIDSTGLFGFINIFGNWTGDIGGQSEFAALDADQNSVTPQVNDNSSADNTNSNSDSVQESGGQLAVTNFNNTGAYVYPGDTVTFFIRTTNTGTGKVYGAKLNLYLVYEGNPAGGTQFSLGDIEPGRSVEVDTGFVLSRFSPPGPYTARAYVTGNVGPNNSQINAVADSSFTVFGEVAGTVNPNNHKGPKTEVLGTKTNDLSKASAAKKAEDLLYFSLLVLTLFAYISIRLIRKREYVYAFFQSDNFKEKLYTLRMLLL